MINDSINTINTVCMYVCMYVNVRTRGRGQNDIFKIVMELKSIDLFELFDLSRSSPRHHLQDASSRLAGWRNRPGRSCLGHSTRPQGWGPKESALPSEGDGSPSDWAETHSTHSLFNALFE